MTTTPAWAVGVCAGVHVAGSRDVVYVPDNPLSHVLRNAAQVPMGRAMRRIAATATVHTPAELTGALDVASVAPPGPVFIVAKVRESAPTAKPPLDCVFIKQRFMSAIRNPESAMSGCALPGPPS